MGDINTFTKEVKGWAGGMSGVSEVTTAVHALAGPEKETAKEESRVVVQEWVRDALKAGTVRMWREKVEALNWSLRATTKE